ncbi:NAD+ synthase [Candidatus Woesearchaeota archaeon]|nr:NAD+ synthase [Candidatus Woesearchaeota archaeon]
MEHEKIIKKIEDFIREKVGGMNGVVLGISGGIDSTVVAWLATRALGKDKVFGVLMPYGVQDTRDSMKVVELLGIQHQIVNIKPFVDAIAKDALFFDDKLALGNLMARIRMSLLYGAANSMKRLVIGTGNKSELEIGYFTKYGDGGVDFEPIGGLYKTEVWQIAEYLGIPTPLIVKEPSAGLYDGQTDEEEIGLSYHEIDKILKGEIGDIPKEHVNKINKMRQGAQHKLVMPPSLKLEV